MLFRSITGLKTGTTSQAGSCITATAERNGLRLIAVILGAGSTDDRFKDAAALLDYGFGGWSVTVPESPALPDVPVKGGMEETVGAIAGESPEILMETASMGEIEQDISWTPELRAPVRKGDVIGRITYSAKGETVAQVDITAAGDVEKISFSSAFTYLLHSFLGL